MDDSVARHDNVINDEGSFGGEGSEHALPVGCPHVHHFVQRSVCALDEVSNLKEDKFKILNQM